jgi:hypothetical protein
MLREGTDARDPESSFLQTAYFYLLRLLLLLLLTAYHLLLQLTAYCWYCVLLLLRVACYID